MPHILSNASQMNRQRTRKNRAPYRPLSLDMPQNAIDVLFPEHRKWEESSLAKTRQENNVLLGQRSHLYTKRIPCMSEC